ncbi:MAG: transcriptional regulator, GntR family [candidate division NC10 bacterium]|jgi:DNA-binding GntR family transcriptional regulator|nr:transcriptional regulator, GntR family [candidate division NC10 bacterium]
MAQESLAHRINAIQNTAEVIAQSLKEMIHEAELKPGQPLIQERIAEMFEVSRVPVRDALQLLIGMGLAVNVPRRGVIVRPLSWQLLDELFEVRKILEGAAIRMAMRNATPEHHRRLDSVIARQAECLKAGDAKRNAALDDEFHRLLYDSVGNTRLVELIFANWEMIKQARCASTVTPEHGRAWIGTSIKRHKRLLAAIKREDEAAACAAIFENIESSQREITACLREMGWIERKPGSGVGPPSGEGRARRGRRVAES